MSDKVIIFYTTLRDGEQCPGASMNLREKMEVARQLARLNVDVIEAGFPVISEGDFEAVQRIGSQLEAGTVWLNEIHQYSPHQAFGGHKQSGIGCENSLHGLMEYTNWQTITLHKKAALGAAT